MTNPSVPFRKGLNGKEKKALLSLIFARKHLSMILSCWSQRQNSHGPQGD